MRSPHRSNPVPWPLALLLLLPAATPAPAEIELGSNARIIGPDEVMDRYVEEVDGVLWLELPGRGRWELSTAASADQSAFYPPAPDVVAEAWSAIAAPFTEALEVTLVVLPFPRAALPISSAEDGLIYLSPSETPLTARQVHFLVSHEVGHCLHRATLAEDSDWDVYLELRGLDDAGVFHDWAAHAYRPREIFAEDFRFLFGGADANYSGTIENASLPLPAEVPGLRAFFHSLVLSGGPSPATVGVPGIPTLRVLPTPTRGPTIIVAAAPAGSATGPGRLTLFDARGRVVRELSARSGDALRFHWDGSAAGGDAVAGGVYFAELDAPGAGRARARIVLVR